MDTDTQEKALTQGSLGRDGPKPHFPRNSRNRDAVRVFSSRKLILVALTGPWSKNALNTSPVAHIDWGRPGVPGSPHPWLCSEYAVEAGPCGIAGTVDAGPASTVCWTDK